MQLQLSTLLDGVPGAVYAAVAIAIATVVISTLCKDKLDAIPIVGASGWFGSWRAAQRFQTNAEDIIQEGYKKYKSRPFRVADRYRWIVILPGRQHIQELRNIPNDVLSFIDTVNESMKLEYTMGPGLFRDQYHGDVVRSQLTRSLSSLFSEIRNEVSVAFDEVLDLNHNKWKSVIAMKIIHQVVCRASNRLFVGLPLCRDPEWIGLNLRYTLDVLNESMIFRRFPHFLAPIVALFLPGYRSHAKRALKHLAPIIEERLKLQEEYGNGLHGKPNDLITWLLDSAPARERTVLLWTVRILAINFAAIHTGSNSFADALFLLAENPQHIQPLREEVETIVEKEGWSKASIARMHKIDSFLKESQRLVGLGSLALLRFAVQDLTLSDGTFIPKGTMTAVPIRALHLDDKLYDNAHVFNPFRFSDMREKLGDDAKYHYVSTSPEFLPFGHGIHACPGRFFAVNELKIMLAHVVMSYDVKMEDNMSRPDGKRDGLRTNADPFAKIMFRRRVQ